MRRYKLAVVENDEDELFFMREAFNAFEGFDILGEFGNGDQLLDWLHTEPAVLPELILSDLNMPGKNGYDIISEVKAGFQEIPVIVTSTSSIPSTMQKCLSLGAFAFLIKPDVFIAYGPYVERLYELINNVHHKED